MKMKLLPSFVHYLIRLLLMLKSCVREARRQETDLLWPFLSVLLVIKNFRLWLVNPNPRRCFKGIKKKKPLGIPYYHNKKDGWNQ